MTIATATKEEFDIETAHPVWSAKYGIQTATTGLKKLVATEAALAEQRLAIIKTGSQAPVDEERLENLESEINRLQTRQTREQDKIKALTDELPELREEAQAQLDKLTELRKQLPKVTSEIEEIDSRLSEVLSKELTRELIGLVEKRNQAVKELRGIPFLISNVRSYFHLQPGVEQIDVPQLPEHIRTLIEALSK